VLVQQLEDREAHGMRERPHRAGVGELEDVVGRLWLGGN
jgi:hypothetical protein